MRYIGIDSGSTTTKGVLMDKTSVLYKVILPTGHKPAETIRCVYEQLLVSAAGEPVYTVVTGYGRELLPEADKKVTEITCHGRGAAFLGSEQNAHISAVIDIGGQDSKVIQLDRDGMIVDFLMNDKCAAGTGRFVEVILKLLKTQVEDMDHYVAGAFPMKISSMCTVFAESEVISLLANDAKGGAIALGVLHSICERTVNFAKRLPLSETIFFSGGLAQSEVMTQLLSEKLNLSVVTHPMAQWTGAIGAAVIGMQKKPF